MIPKLRKNADHLFSFRVVVSLCSVEYLSGFIIMRWYSLILRNSSSVSSSCDRHSWKVLKLIRQSDSHMICMIPKIHQELCPELCKHGREKRFLLVKWKMCMKMNILKSWSLGRPSTLTHDFNLITDLSTIGAVVKEAEFEDEQSVRIGEVVECVGKTVFLVVIHLFGLWSIWFGGVEVPWEILVRVPGDNGGVKDLWVKRYLYYSKLNAKWWGLEVFG